MTCDLFGWRDGGVVIRHIDAISETEHRRLQQTASKCSIDALLFVHARSKARRLCKDGEGFE